MLIFRAKMSCPLKLTELLRLPVGLQTDRLSARHRAYDRELWREIVETATLQQGQAT